MPSLAPPPPKTPQKRKAPSPPPTPATPPRKLQRTSKKLASHSPPPSNTPRTRVSLPPLASSRDDERPRKWRWEWASPAYAQAARVFDETNMIARFEGRRLTAREVFPGRFVEVEEEEEEGETVDGEGPARNGDRGMAAADGCLPVGMPVTEVNGRLYAPWDWGRDRGESRPGEAGNRNGDAGAAPESADLADGRSVEGENGEHRDAGVNGRVEVKDESGDKVNDGDEEEAEDEAYDGDESVDGVGVDAYV